MTTGTLSGRISKLRLTLTREQYAEYAKLTDEMAKLDHRQHPTQTQRLWLLERLTVGKQPFIGDRPNRREGSDK